MKKLPPFDYALAEKLQKEAAARSSKFSRTLGKYDRPKTSLILRHRAKWSQSWDRIGFEEIELTEDLLREMTCMFMKCPDTSYTLNVAKDEKSKDHIAKSIHYSEEEAELTAEIEILQNDLQKYENDSYVGIISPSMWSELFLLSSETLQNILPEIINSIVELEMKKVEINEKLQIIENDFSKTCLKSKMWLNFVQDIWPTSHNGDSTLLSNDLKNLVCGKNYKLRSNLVQLDRIQLALKQHKIKQKSFKIHFSNEIKMIFDIIKSIGETEKERIVKLSEKVGEAESFKQHRNNLRKRLEKMKSEREKKLKIEEEKYKIEEEKRLADQREKDIREREARDKMRKEIHNWRLEEERKLDDLKSFNEMVEFEKKQDFYEKLPLLKEAAERREKLRLAKLEDRKLAELEAEEEKKRKEEILDRLRAQVAVEGEINPARLVQNTENWKNRKRENELKSGLFEINSFSDKQLMNDKRLQFELYLRKANIPINSYALETLKAFNPPTQPRRDNLHTNLYQ